MTLLELLVKELHKYGGWPEGMACACQSMVDGEIYFYRKLYCDGVTDDRLCDFSIYPNKDDKSDNHTNGYLYVTREQYESALAASQKAAWRGDGLPPVGCVVEVISKDAPGYVRPFPVVIDAAMNGCFIASCMAGGVLCGEFSEYKFTPFRSEADKKRDAALDAIYGAIASAKREHNRSDEADKVYEAIAAGKIPGVKLED